jgi:hypothetical protein
MVLESSLCLCENNKRISFASEHPYGDRFMGNSVTANPLAAKHRYQPSSVQHAPKMRGLLHDSQLNGKVFTSLAFDMRL